MFGITFGDVVLVDGAILIAVVFLLAGFDVSPHIMRKITRKPETEDRGRTPGEEAS
jgi:hypothetical protein